MLRRTLCGPRHLPAVWLSTLVLLLMCTVFAPGLWAQLPWQIDENEVQQMTPAQGTLTVVRPTDPEFETLLNTYFSGISTLANYQELRPLLVILRNETTHGAKAYDIEWVVRDANGGMVTTFGTRKIATRLMFMPGQVWISPQDMRLLGPLLSASPAQYQQMFAPNPNALSATLQAHHLPGVPESGSVEVTIDGVIFNDGTFAGPNHRHLWERYVAARNAEHDEALAVLNLLNASTPQPQWVEILRHRARAVAGGGPSADVERAWYLDGRSETARDLLRILRHQGSDGLLAAVQRVANYTNPKGQFTDMRRWTAPGGGETDSPTGP